jgi:hypothetical protein
MLHIGQFPLAGRRRDLAADIAFDRVARQDDLGAARSGNTMIEHAGIVIVEEPEPRPAIRLHPHRAQKPPRIGVAHRLRDAQNVSAVGIADEIRIERLSVAVMPKCVQVRLKEIRSRPHFRERRRN